MKKYQLFVLTSLLLSLLVVGFTPTISFAEEPFPVSWSNGAILPTGEMGVVAIDSNQLSGPCSNGNYDSFTGSVTPLSGLAELAHSGTAGTCGYMLWQVDLSSVWSTNSLNVALISPRKMNSFEVATCVGSAAVGIFDGNALSKLGSCGFTQFCGSLNGSAVPCAGLWDGSPEPKKFYVYGIGLNLSPVSGEFTVDPGMIPEETLKAGGLNPSSLYLGSSLGPSLWDVLGISRINPPESVDISEGTAAAERDDSLFFTPSTFSLLPTFRATPAALAHLGLTAGVTLVMGILVMLPTSLLNNTLSANNGWLMRLMRIRKQRNEEPQSALIMFWRALPVLTIAAVITGFADPNFGFNFLSLRVVLTTLLSFILVNYLGVLAAWLFIRKTGAFKPPVLRARWSFLIIVIATVWFSKLAGIQPVIVFGSLVAVEALLAFTSATADVGLGKQEETERKLRGRLEVRVTFATIAIGIIAWLGYSFIVSIAPEWNESLIVALGEFAAVITIEALATLPVALLPLRFLPGSALYEWNKSVWFFWYLVGVTLFLYVLIPLPESWEQVTVELPVWYYVLGGYFVFACVVWVFFKIFNPKKNGPVPITVDVPGEQ